MCNLLTKSVFASLLKSFGLSIYNDSFFTVESENELIVPGVSNPAFLDGMTQVRDIKGFELDISTQSIKNISGRTLSMVGTMAVQYEQTGSQDCELYIYSEYSSDGINWNYNPNSLREVVIEKTGIQYTTIPSLNIGNWENGGYIRFKFAKDGNGGILIEEPIKTIDSIDMKGHSFIWTMRELQK